MGPDTVLVFIALLLFLATAFGVSHPRVSLGWLGLAFLAASMLV